MKKCILWILIVSLCVLLTACGHEHAMVGEVVEQYSCTTDGVMKYNCAECDYSYDETTPCTGHNYGEGKVIDEATCTKLGVLKYECIACGDEKTDPIPLQHVFENTDETGKVTCTQGGVIEKICTRCGYEETTETEASGHSFVGDTCTKCDAVKADIDANSWYTYEPLDILKVQNCIVSNATARTYGAGAIVSYYAVCKECHIATDLLDLVVPEVNYPIAKTYICDDCGATTIVRLEIAN